MRLRLSVNWTKGGSLECRLVGDFRKTYGDCAEELVSDEARDIATSYQAGADSYLMKSVVFLSKGAVPTAILDTVLSLAGA